MPTANTRKIYLAGATYHIYNRANNRLPLFKSNRDYRVFLKYLREKLHSKAHPLSPRKNFHKKIKLFAFCLMPTHFHLLIRQHGKKDICKFMQSLQLSYSFYKKCAEGNRGRLYEDRYKARLISTKGELLKVSRYIHRNPVEIGKDIEDYEYSSLKLYLRKKPNMGERSAFLETGPILDLCYGSSEMYLNYVLSERPGL